MSDPGQIGRRLPPKPAPRAFDGKKNPSRRAALESHRDLGHPLIPGLFREYRKKTTIFAVRMESSFEVDTLEGLHEGKAGDYLAVGVHGEMYPIEAAVFEASYYDAYEEVDP